MLKNIGFSSEDKYKYCKIDTDTYEEGDDYLMFNISFYYEGKDNMTFSYCPGKNNESVIFLFDNDKAVTIYAETEGAISDRIDAAVRKVYYNTWHIRTDGTMAYYYLDENPYDGKGHTMQSYSLIYFYIPRDWWNGNGRD